MDSKLLKEWEKFSLTEEEDAIIGGEFEAINDEEAKNQLSLILMGKLLTNKPFNVEAMKRTLISIWRSKEIIAIRMIETNLFVFQFFNKVDKERVIQGSPWFF